MLIRLPICQISLSRKASIRAMSRALIRGTSNSVANCRTTEQNGGRASYVDNSTPQISVADSSTTYASEGEAKKPLMVMIVRTHGKLWYGADSSMLSNTQTAPHNRAKQRAGK